MKKKYSTREYKRKNLRRLRSLAKTKKRKFYYETIDVASVSFINDNIVIDAPEDFRLIENRNKTLSFYRDIRSREKGVIDTGSKFISISLKDVKFIDQAAITVLTAIREDLKYSGVFFRGNFPKDKKCQKIIEQSGFLNGMYDENDKLYKRSRKSDLILLEAGAGKLTNDQNIKIGEVLKNVVNHLTGEQKHFNPVKTALLEICGNSIEHSGTICQNWLFGVKYEEGKVIFTIVDVGKGILKTLYKTFGKKCQDFVTFNDNKGVLQGAFDKKYGSSTQEVNRNKGLPSIRRKSDNGVLKNLVVISNNVILHFNDENQSEIFGKGEAWMKGTFFQWEMTRECIENINIEE